MSTALTQQRAVEIAEQQGFHVLFQKELHAAMEQYHREASAQPASGEPVAYMQEYWGPDCGPQYEIYKADDMAWRDKTKWTPLFTATPDAEALRKRVSELEVECERLRKAIEAMRVAGGSSEFQAAFDRAKALAARKEG